MACQSTFFGVGLWHMTCLRRLVNGLHHLIALWGRNCVSMWSKRCFAQQTICTCTRVGVDLHNFPQQLLSGDRVGSHVWDLLISPIQFVLLHRLLLSAIERNLMFVLPLHSKLISFVFKKTHKERKPSFIPQKLNKKLWHAMWSWRASPTHYMKDTIITYVVLLLSCNQSIVDWASPYVQQISWSLI